MHYAIDPPLDRTLQPVPYCRRAGNAESSQAAIEYVVRIPQMNNEQVRPHFAVTASGPLRRAD